MYRKRRYKPRYGRRRFKGRRRMPRRYVGKVRRSGLYGRFAGTMAAPRRPELKFFDNNITNVATAVGGAFLFSSLNIIGQGVSESERIGVRINIRTIQISGALLQLANTTASGAATSNRVRMLLVLDKQTNGAAANLNDVINPVVDGMRDVANYSRFVVLKSWLVGTNSQAGAGDGTTSGFGEMNRKISFYKRCNIPLRFDGATGGITEIATNNIFLAAWREDTNPVVNITAQIRLRYSDS